jgi:hypothetical protein
VHEDRAATYERETEDETLTCRVVHAVGAKTSVSTPEGTLTLLDLEVTVVSATSGAHR